MKEKTSKNKKLKFIGLTSLCLALATPFVFAGCSADPESVKGPKGDAGESAYEIAKRVDPDGVGNMTEKEWINSLKGDKGDKGDTGAKGEAGAKGDKGDTGATGEEGASIAGVTSEIITSNGKPAIKFTFTKSDGDQVTTTAALPTILEFDPSYTVTNDLMSVLGATSSIFNQIGAVSANESNKFTVKQVKEELNLPNYTFYVNVGEFTEYYVIDGIRIGESVYDTESMTSLSIGNNNFIEDVAFYTDGNQLFVAAPLLFELEQNFNNFEIFNNTGEADAESSSAYIGLDFTEATPFIPDMSIDSNGGTILWNPQKSTENDCFIYEVSLKNGKTPIKIGYPDKTVGDIIVTRITEFGEDSTLVRYAIDTITAENQDFVGYPAGWIEDDAWVEFTSATRQCDIMVFRQGEDGMGIYVTQYITIATKALDYTLSETIANDVNEVNKYVQNNIYNKIANTSTDGTEQIFTWEEVKSKLSPSESTEGANTFQNYVKVAQFNAGENIATVAFGILTVLSSTSDDTTDSTTLVPNAPILTKVKEYTKGEKTQYGIGNNIFVTQEAYYVDADGNLYIAADLLKTFGSCCNAIIVNGDTIIQMEQLLVNDIIELTYVPKSGAKNIITVNDANLVTATINDTTEYIQFTYDGANVGDQITIIEFDMNYQFVGSGIDTYTEENKVFFYESHGKPANQVEEKVRRFTIITPQGVAELTLCINAPNVVEPSA